MEWSELIEASNKAEWPSFEKQQYVKKGLLYLQEFFGERVLKLAMESYHPYFTETYNWAPWNLLLYAGFGHRLEALKSVPNSTHRLNQLRKSARENPGRSSIEMFFGFFNEVEIAYPLVKQGLSLEFIKETLTPTPDLKVNFEGRWLNIEITNLRDPASYWDANIFKARLRDAIVANFSNIPYILKIRIGRLWENIAGSQEEVITEIITGIKQILKSSPPEVQFNIQGIQIEASRLVSSLCMIPPEGPFWKINYLQKIQRAIIDKGKQLQIHGPAVIVICDNVFNFSIIPKTLPRIEEFINNLIKEMPHISGVMLVLDKAGMAKQRQWHIEKSNLLFAQYLLCDEKRLLSKLLVPNLVAKELLTPVEINSLLAYID